MKFGERLHEYRLALGLTIDWHWIFRYVWSEGEFFKLEEQHIQQFVDWCNKVNEDKRENGRSN